MSLKLETIYNYGGGGGRGYEDGGQIEDADVMELKNNTLSYYENISRDAINFYFEPSEDEILNSIVELTTAVNATVNVYVLRNGLYYLLGNIGGNTVTAGNQYKIDITGNSYEINQINVNNQIFVNIEGNLTRVVKIGNLYWTDNVIYAATDYVDKTNYGRKVRYYPWNEIRGSSGFRVPSQNDINSLLSSINNDTDKLKTDDPNAWVTPGNDDLLFSAFPDSYLTSAKVYPLNWPVGSYFAIWTSGEISESRSYYFGFNNGGSYSITSENKDSYLTLRLCKDA